MDYRKEIGAILKVERDKKGISQAALAEKSGVSEIVIKRIESPTYTRTNSVSLPILFKISKALEIHPNEFINSLWEAFKNQDAQ